MHSVRYIDQIKDYPAFNSSSGIILSTQFLTSILLPHLLIILSLLTNYPTHMPTKAERLAAWKAKKAAAASAASSSSLPVAPTAAKAHAPVSTSLKLSKSLSLKMGAKRKAGSVKSSGSAPPSKKINAAFDDSDDEDDADNPASGKGADSRPTFFDEDDEAEDGSAMDVDDDGKDALDAYMMTTLDKSELVEQDTSAIGSKSSLPPQTTTTVITLDEVIKESETVNVDLDEKQTSTLLKVLTGDEGASDPSSSSTEIPGADLATAVIEDLKKKAAEAAKAREQRVEIGRLFGSDDGPEESERLLELYEQDGLSRNAEKVMINKKKFIADVDHASIDYIKVTKNLYVPKEKLRIGKNGLNKEEVQEMRRKIDVKVRGAGVIPVPVSTFEDSGLSPRVLDILSVRMKITQPFPIQAQCLPCIMSGRDVIGIAKVRHVCMFWSSRSLFACTILTPLGSPQTGSGKTLAFVLPLLRHIMSQPPLEPGESGPIGLILAPARELALQIAEVAKRFCKHLNLKSSCVYGGGAVAEQIGELKRGKNSVENFKASSLHAAHPYLARYTQGPKSLLPHLEGLLTF
jgi:hypothetical protein